MKLACLYQCSWAQWDETHERCQNCGDIRKCHPGAKYEWSGPNGTRTDLVLSTSTNVWTGTAVYPLKTYTYDIS